jgi:hypothetical protein
VAIGVAEKIAFDSSRFATLLQHRFMGGPLPAEPAGGMSMDMLASHPLGEFIARPGMWIGLAVTAAFFRRGRLRRQRVPI